MLAEPALLTCLPFLTLSACPICLPKPAGMAVGVEVGPNEEVVGVTTYFGVTFRCRAAVLTTGTFMNGQIWVGRRSMAAGRAGERWGAGVGLRLLQSLFIRYQLEWRQPISLA